MNSAVEGESSAGRKIIPVFGMGLGAFWVCKGVMEESSDWQVKTAPTAMCSGNTQNQTRTSSTVRLGVTPTPCIV